MTHRYPGNGHGSRGVYAALVLAALAASAALTYSLRAAAYAPPFNLQEVAPGNFVHLGKHVTFEDPDTDDIANIGFIVGEKCVAVVDTGGSVAVGRALRDAIRERTSAPICYVINTHSHFDHYFGNIAFRDDKPEFIGHQKLPEALGGDNAYVLEHFGKYLGEHPSNADIILPDRTVDSMLELDLGGKTLRLTAYPTAHTHSDLSVLDVDTGTLWLGDLLFRERLPSFDGSVLGWLKVIGTLEQEQGVRTVIPGHGPVGEELKAALADEKRYMETVVAEVRAQIADGKDIDEAVETVGLSERGRWQLWDQQHKRNVSRAYTELEWE
ncbi:MAG: quinoprotein relay system zinc metallohydrolase 2 [Gammaproteobacteria bacterium]|nr:quinoprotein relay system zinc metallohydrolase 2 [Gammaproteobacteria bacterium]